MKAMRRVGTVLFLLVAALGAALIYAQTAPQSPVKVQPPASVQGKADAPAPPAQAKKGTAVGKGNVAVTTANSAGDQDSFWVEEIDIDGDGNVERTDILWDDEDKVLYLYADGTFTCTKGGTGEGAMLIAIYGKGNAWNKPAGSGWYVVELDKLECAAQAAAVFGCRFDAKGNPTACGAATIDAKNDDIVIVSVSK
ncbi:MAG: hypothetical protein ACREKR_01025 [Candidatus Methylomirabilales bacterium]